MNSIQIYAKILFIVTLCSFAKQSSGQHTLRGKLVDSRDGGVIGHAEIIAYNDNGEEVGTMLSDRFTGLFEVVLNQQAQLAKVSKPGFLPLRLSLDSRSNLGTIEMSREMEPQEDGEEEGHNCVIDIGTFTSGGQAEKVLLLSTYQSPGANAGSTYTFLNLNIPVEVEEQIDFMRRLIEENARLKEEVEQLREADRSTPGAASNTLAIQGQKD